MTTEEKAKAYDEAIERAKKVLLDCTPEEQKVVEYISPELKESEDEKIRKVLIKETKGSEVRLFEAVTNDEFVAWLEKQGQTFTKKDVDDAYLKGVCDTKQELERQCEKTNPYSGISFEYNGHFWGMCARDNGVDIVLDKYIIRHLEPIGKEPNWGEDDGGPCLAELAEGKVTTSDGISGDMMSVRIERTPLSTRAKNVLRYQFDTIGDMVPYCDGKWRRLRGLRNLGKVTYNEIMEYLGIDDRL